MPNHVDNTLSVVGDPETVARFVAAARGKKPRTGDPKPEGNSYGNYISPEEWAARPDELFEFHSLVPLPAAYSQVPYSTSSDRQPSGYNMEHETWGVKWGAYHRGEDWTPPVIDPGHVTYEFRTAWSPPSEVFLPKVAAKWPGLTFFLSYGGEGPCRGRYLWSGGGEAWAAPEDYKSFRSEYPHGENEDYEPPYPSAEHDAWVSAGNAVTHARQRSHMLWVGHWVARRAGYPFGEFDGPVFADLLDELGHAELARSARSHPAAVPIGPVDWDGVPW